MLNEHSKLCKGIDDVLAFIAVWDKNDLTEL